MPYSTTVYADGLGGQTSVETWGLQYYPAGWVTTTSQENLFVSWGPYTLAGDNSVTLTGNANYGYNTLNHIEDGTGINYTAVGSTTVTMANGHVIASDQMNTGADRYRITFNAAALTADIADYSIFPVYGTVVGVYSTDLLHSAPCQNFVIGTENGNLLADGYGSNYGSNPTVTWNSASYLGHCGSQQNGWHFYHHDGSGNVTEGYAPTGFVLYYDSSSSNFAWSAPDGGSGNYAYATSESTETASDDVGGITYGGSSWDAPDGQEIYAGSYTSGQDESGNDIIQYFTVNFTNHTYAGDGGPYYNINNV